MGNYMDYNTENKSDEETMPPATRSGIVANAKYVNLREDPNRAGKKLVQLSAGTKVEILDETGDYFRVKVKYFPEAYVAKHFIKEE